MKRNIVPLLGIAFVVAIISTGVFYGLFAGRLRSSESDVPSHAVLVAARDLEQGAILKSSDVRAVKVPGTLAGTFSKPSQVLGSTLLAAVKQDEPLLDSRMASKDPVAGSANGAVPAGMRALSIHVSQSEGLAALLHPGSKVDLQSVVDKNGAVALRTILEDVEVLAFNPPAQAATFAMTVLVPASAEEQVALADAGSRVRVALRNPLDSGSRAGHSVLIPASQRHQASRKAERSGDSVQVQVKVLSVSPAARAELDSKSAAKGGAGLEVASLGTDAEARELVGRLESKKEAEVVRDHAFAAAVGESGVFRVGSGKSRLRVQVIPEAGANGRTKLKIEPEVSRASGPGVETTRYQASLAGAGTFLIEGLLGQPGDRAALEKLFPGHTWADRSLVIIVSAQPDRSAVSVLPQSNRGQ